MTEFNSKVSPQVNLGNSSQGDTYSTAFEKYNQHTHALASTGNPYSMGLKLGDSVNGDGIAFGTTINKLFLDKIELSKPALEDLTTTRLYIQEDFILESCDIEAGSKIVKLNRQSGFISPSLLKNALTNEVHGYLSLKTKDYNLFFSDKPQYLSNIKFILSPAPEAKAEIQIFKTDIESEKESKVIWSGIVDSRIQFSQSFNIQEFADNTLFNENKQLTLRVLSIKNALSLSYYFKFYKIAL